MDTESKVKISWRDLAREKREDVDNKIPREWRLSSAIPSAEDQPDITGEYIRRYLDSGEVDITESSAVEVLSNIGSGRWGAEEVARAFCHRAALAHQMVSFPTLEFYFGKPTQID